MIYGLQSINKYFIASLEFNTYRGATDEFRMQSVHCLSGGTSSTVTISTFPQLLYFKPEIDRNQAVQPEMTTAVVMVCN